MIVNSGGEFRDILRISDAEYRAIETELSAQIESHAAASRRGGRRYAYFVSRGLEITFEQPGQPARFVVRPHDLSEEGLGVLHGAFVYTGVACTTRLVARDGEAVLAKGRVRHCRCVRGRVHYVGIRFDRAIALDLFVNAPVSGGAQPARESLLSLTSELERALRNGGDTSALRLKLDQIRAGLDDHVGDA